MSCTNILYLEIHFLKILAPAKWTALSMSFQANISCFWLTFSLTFILSGCEHANSVAGCASEAWFCPYVYKVIFSICKSLSSTKLKTQHLLSMSLTCPLSLKEIEIEADLWMLVQATPGHACLQKRSTSVSAVLEQDHQWHQFTSPSSTDFPEW